MEVFGEVWTLVILVGGMGDGSHPVRAQGAKYERGGGW
jgi:hypothetical protein